MTTPPYPTPYPRIVLVLGGGNALGSYQAGVYQALHERGIEPRWIVGTSAGAINGALIAGNPRDDRLDRLTAFWEPADAAGTPWWFPVDETARRTSAVMATVAGGRPGLFGAIGPFGSWWHPDAAAAAPSLFNAQPLGPTLARLIDFDRLADADGPRLSIGAVDLDTGDDVVFDTTRDRITADHVRASAALLPSFAPVTIGDRAYVDGGVSANLPLDPALDDPAAPPTLCIAVDLLPLAAARPATLGEAISRAQDLVFAAQSRRTIERWRCAYRHDPRFAASAVALVRLTYADQDVEVAGKGMDFSPESVRHRWSAGHRDATAMLERFDRGNIAIGPGLTVFDA